MASGGSSASNHHADSPFIFEGLTAHLSAAARQGSPRPCVLEGWRVHQGRAPLILVDRSQGRDQAEAWRGADGAGQGAATCPRLDDDEVRPEDLIGLAVRHVNGNSVGILADVREVAGQELWYIHDDQEREILLPAVEEFVLDIDLDAGIIVIDPPEGLLELYQNP